LRRASVRTSALSWTEAVELVNCLDSSMERVTLASMKLRNDASHLFSGVETQSEGSQMAQVRRDR
jgi:hypothetical protein